jgi:uncharacterized protein YndB with AHSA1/START domain
MTSNTVSLHRVFKANPEKLYRAFTEPNALSAWLPPYGFVADVQHMNVVVGGSFRMSFTNFSTRNVQSFGGKYLEVDANTLLKYTDEFDDPNLPGEMLTTVLFKQVSVGTEVNITQEGIPSAIPAEACYLGWEESLEKLKRLVETEVSD